jgi:hypothetical protein
MATELQPRDPGKRKTALVTIDADNRDRGKRFLITEMSAFQTEHWGRRLVAKLAREGVPVPAAVASLGMAALPSYPILTYLSWIDDQALVGELIDCVQTYVEAAGVPMPHRLRENEIEEAITIIHLRMEVIALCAGFTLADFLWSHLPALAELLSCEKPAGSSTTQTSPETSPSP